MINQDCLFCQIAAGEMPAKIVYQDETMTAFLDLNPNNPGHTLVIPNRHYKNLFDLPDQLLAIFFPKVKKVAAGVKTSQGAGGLNMIMNNEPDSGQTIFHTHIHLIPRFAGDGLKPWPTKSLTETEMSKIQEQIKQKLQII